ncbi:MAG: ribokinase [Candidatus Brocadiae bacterium]|nr:ribokinase [Candidatus Brocadiia bacterium]
MTGPRIVVVGSANTDLTVISEWLPSRGETVMADQLVRAGGGKGANQAVAAARAGAEAAFVGRVGDDDFGRGILRDLAREGINTERTIVDEQTHTGVALIMVDKKGENIIGIARGANGRLRPTDVDAAHDVIETADMLLLQLEIPLDTVMAAIGTARAAGVRVLLNPAPAPSTGAPRELTGGADYLTPNSVEAVQLLRAEGGEEPEALAGRLVESGAGAVILTLGAAGACICDGEECYRVRAPQVAAVDSTGAGDCFSGVLAVALSEGMELPDAARFAACAAALCVQVPGAQPSMPRRTAIEQLFEQHEPH